jgi:glycogen debranching enzyme
MQQKHLGEIYTDLTYVQGSLRNLGSGKGWTFVLANPPLPLAGAAEALHLTVDGRPVPPDRTWVRTGGQVVRADNITRDSVLVWYVGQESVFWVEGNELPPGEHEVVIAVKPLGFGDLSTTFRFVDTVGTVEPTLVTRERFDQPVALANGQAFAVLNRAGDLSADWNWFGLKTDNGGLYLPPARFLRHLRFGVEAGGEVQWLAHSTTAARLLPGRLESWAEPLKGVTVERTVFLPPEEATAVVRFTVANRGTEPVALDLVADFAAALVPYGLLGVQLRTLNTEAVEDGIVRCGTPELSYRVALGASMPPTSAELAAGSGHLRYRLEVAPGCTVGFDFAVHGTVDGSDPALGVRAALAQVDTLQERAAARFRTALAESIQIETPDPDVNQSWTFARLALQHLCFRHPEIGAGICAGLPRFPNYWSRDSAWAAMGLLAAGETEFVREVLENFFKHQLREDRPEAQAGDLPTVISGPAFMHLLGYGTSADGPLLMTILLAEYVFQSGDLEFAAQHVDGVRRILAWARRQDRDGDGYLEHGVDPGVTTSHAIAIPDTTWMDHIDRRKSANDIQGLFWQALRRAADVAEALGHADEAAAWRREAEELEERFWRDFFPEGADHPYDRLLPDGQGDPTLRPNYAVNLLFASHLDTVRAERALRALELETVRAPHGIRTLASTEPGYDPISYHHGCVWNLVTGWTAMAAFRHDRIEMGYNLVRTLATGLIREFGQAPELYRGDRPEAFNGCFLQAWSVSVLLQAVGRYLLGIRPDAVAGILDVAPCLPENWRSVGVRGVRVGDALVDLRLIPGRLEAFNRGSAGITIRFAGHEAFLAPGANIVL